MYKVGASLIACASFAAALDVHDHVKHGKIMHGKDEPLSHVFRDGAKDLVFFHVPMNFGNSIALTAAMGSGSSYSYDDVNKAAHMGWFTVNQMVASNAPVWGPLNPDLQEKSKLGYPMYYTPPEMWPKFLAEKYFGNKKVFGILRDPYERIVSTFRGTKGGVAKGWNFRPDGRVCAEQLNQYVTKELTPLLFNPYRPPPQDPNLHVQATYFEGQYGITLPVDLDTFPLSVNKLLEEHGYNFSIQINDMMHIKGCDDTWSGDLDEHSKGLIKQYYAEDFHLRCKHFGYCDEVANHCLVHVPGMCPAKLYTWDKPSAMYFKH